MMFDARVSCFGAWLSLVERPVRDREVAGSNPVAPIDRRRKPESEDVPVAQLDRATAF